MTKTTDNQDQMFSPELTVAIYCGVGINGRGEFDERILEDIGEVWYVAKG